MSIREVVIVSACRTPIGKFMGQFKDISARDLAITAGKEAIRRAGIDASMIYEMQREDYKIGCASLCVGGGPAMASVWTREIG